MQPRKLSAHVEMGTCMQKVSKTPALLKRLGCWKHMLSGQKPAPSKSGGSCGLADPVTGSPRACVLQGRAKKATWPTCLGLPGMTHPTPAQKHCLHSLRKVKLPQLVVAFGERAYCAHSCGENTINIYGASHRWPQHKVE